MPKAAAKGLFVLTGLAAELALAAPRANAEQLVTLEGGRQVHCRSVRREGNRVICQLASGDLRWSAAKVARIEDVEVPIEEEAAANTVASAGPRPNRVSTTSAAAAKPAAATADQKKGLNTGGYRAELLALRREADTAAAKQPEARRNLSTRFNNLGAKVMESGDVLGAIEIFGDAVQTNGRNRVALGNLALAYLRQGDLYFAQYYLQLAESGEGESFPDLYAILGEVYYQQNRLAEAIANWEKYLRLGGGDAGLRVKLDKARRERKIDGGQQTFTGPRFTFFYDAGVDIELVAEINGFYDEAYGAEVGFFGSNLPDNQVVVLYSTRSYFTMTSTPDWVSGLYDGKIRVPVKPETGLDEELEKVLRHELAHAFVQTVAQGNAPTWVHEGVAQWREGRRASSETLAFVFVNHPPFALAELERSYLEMRSDEGSTTAYVQSLSMIEYMAERHGDAAILRLLRGLGEGEPLDRVLASATGSESRGFVTAWKDWITGGMR